MTCFPALHTFFFHHLCISVTWLDAHNVPRWMWTCDVTEVHAAHEPRAYRFALNAFVCAHHNSFNNSSGETTRRQQINKLIALPAHLIVISQWMRRWKESCPYVEHTQLWNLIHARSEFIQLKCTVDLSVLSVSVKLPALVNILKMQMQSTLYNKGLLRY